MVEVAIPDEKAYFLYRELKRKFGPYGKKWKQRHDYILNCWIIEFENEDDAIIFKLIS
jgi:hypothetical protein